VAECAAHSGGGGGVQIKGGNCGEATTISGCRWRRESGGGQTVKGGVTRHLSSGRSVGCGQGRRSRRRRWQTAVGHMVGCRGSHGKGPDQPFVERPISGIVGVEVDAI
jgi:hypothetical protein